MGYYLVRVELGLARAFHALRMHKERNASLSNAGELLTMRRGYSFDFLWEGGDAQAHFDLARCHAALGNQGEALQALGKAVECGWRDLPSLGSPELAALRQIRALDQVVASARRYADLPEPA